MGKVRKRRHSGRSKKEKLSLIPLLLPASSPSPRVDDVDGGSLDRLGIIVYDLIMWTDVAKSCLSFGIGCICILSSCFAKGSNFSNLVSNVETRREFELKEGDILPVGRYILPAANLVISKIRELFSGEPSRTCKVIPFLLLGAEFGHLITLWRLCAIGFIISFSIPKLYSRYSSHVNTKVECTKCWVLEAWEACFHTTIFTVSAIRVFWNLSSIKTCIFTAFISLIILRCCQQQLVQKQEECEVEQEEQERWHALVVTGVSLQKQ